MTLPVSIIVPVYNDPEGVRTTIRSLLPRVSDAGVRVVVVDNGSTDATPAVIDEYADGESIVHLLESDVQSSYAARNTGVRRVQSDVLAFLDADMTVPDGWLDRALDEFDANDADYMGCSVELTLPENPSLAARFDRHTGFQVEQYIERQHFAPTCCLFVRREVFEDVGLFDHRLTSGGDKEFGNRVHDAGYDMHFAADATMYHPVRSSIRDLVEKDLRVGRGHCQLQRYHPDRYGRPGIPPRPSGIKSPDSDLPRRDRIAFGALSKFLEGVRAAGYFSEAARTGFETAPSEPPELD